MNTPTILETWTVCALFGTLATYWLLENLNNLERVTPFPDTEEGKEHCKQWDDRQLLIDSYAFLKLNTPLFLLGLLFAANYLIFLVPITSFVFINLGLDDYRFKK